MNHEHDQGSTSASGEGSQTGRVARRVGSGSSISDLPVRPVIVGVDGSRAARQATLWGAYEARLSRARLEIWHVQPTLTDMLGVDVDLTAGRSLVAACARDAADLEPELDIKQSVITAPDLVSALVEPTETAQLLVLGVDPSRVRASFGMTGPLEDRVSVHARCPVVLVAPYAFIAPGARPYVTVGWTDTHAGQLALKVAAREAALRGSTLNVVTAPPTLDPGLAAVRGTPSQEPKLITALADLETRHPGLVFDVRHTRGDIIEALSELTDRSELLVLGAHHSERRWENRVGPVAQGLLRNGHCPVMLVGHIVPTPAPVHPGHTAC